MFYVFGALERLLRLPGSALVRLTVIFTQFLPDVLLTVCPNRGQTPAPQQMTRRCDMLVDFWLLCDCFAAVLWLSWIYFGSVLTSSSVLTKSRKWESDLNHAVRFHTKVDNVCTNNDKCCTKNDELCTKNDKCCTKNDEICTKNDECCTKNDEICTKNDELCTKNDKCCTKHDELCTKNDEFSPRNRWTCHIRWVQRCRWCAFLPILRLKFAVFDCFVTVLWLFLRLPEWMMIP